MHRAFAVLALCTFAASARAEAWRSDVADGRVIVHVLKRGIFSGLAHDHHFEVTDWSARASIDEDRLEATSVEVALSARSLVDRQEALSEADRRKVNRQAAGPEVLDAAAHPTILFRSERFEVSPGRAPGRAAGTLHGTLSLRGVSRPARVELQAERDGERWRVRGSARVKQSDFGIRPFSGFGGTVGTKDELRIELAIALVPAAPRGVTHAPVKE
jgi:polyisoprenoid-binding protein YceI